MKVFVFILVLSVSVMASELIVKESSCSVNETVQKISNIIHRRGLTSFGIVDHQKNADSVNMIMNESKLIIFGNPKVGTSLMSQNIQSGLDLPMKILVYKDKDSRVKIVYRDLTWIITEHNLSLSSRINKVNDAMNKITTEAGTCTKD